MEKDIIIINACPEDWYYPLIGETLYAAIPEYSTEDCYAKLPWFRLTKEQKGKCIANPIWDQKPFAHTDIMLIEFWDYREARNEELPLQFMLSILEDEVR